MQAPEPPLTDPAQPDPALPPLPASLRPDRYGDPALRLGAEGAARIGAALAAAGGEGTAPAVQALIGASAALFQDRRYLETAHLAAAGGAHPRLVRYQALALNKLRARAALADLIAAEQARPGRRPEALRKTLADLRARHGIALTARDHRQFLDKPPETLAEALAGLRLDSDPALTAMEARLLALRGDPAEDPADFARRLRWGQRAAEYLKFLASYAKSARPEDNPPGAHRRILRLARQAQSLVEPPEASVLERAAAGGRSVLLCMAHAGIPSALRQVPVPAGLTQVRIAANIDTDLDGAGGGGLTLGVHGDFQRDFLKLVKLVKKAPHLIRIFPDGARGGDLLRFDFLDTRVALGPGAATLGWHAQAAVVFCASHWRDGRLQLTLRPGPVADKAMGRDAFDRAFYEFYLGCCRDIVIGPPEDMAASGGFWAHLAKPPQAPDIRP